ncbi:hypothetical protein M5K25_000856 [Dendrobium thyrsiflorum]|uniref:Uncharacterized protein n=1 Tax=Dendrobium thyrsiflorum TaxID=117978 RepID=A0ABD0VXM3_DENTH
MLTMKLQAAGSLIGSSTPKRRTFAGDCAAGFTALRPGNQTSYHFVNNAGTSKPQALFTGFFVFFLSSFFT